MTFIGNTIEGKIRRRLATSAFLVCLVALGCASPGQTPTAVDGRLDLVSWDFAARGDVPLVGTWQICWNRLLTPGEACPSGWRPVPVRGPWSEESVGGPFGGQGVATYRLHIALAPGADSLSLVVVGPLTAHRLWINGVERGGLGTVGRTAETTVAAVSNRIYELEPGLRDVDLEAQVANLEFRGGGLRRLGSTSCSRMISGGAPVQWAPSSRTRRETPWGPM